MKRILSAILLVSVAAISLFAYQDAAKKPVLSPRRQTEAKFGNGKAVSVNYGGPSMRGRKIMGALVPYGKVWRTGANEATKLHTEGDLIVGDMRIPAGDYSLYTLPGESAWKLIINKQTGQSGMVYDEKQDVGRFDMQVTLLEKPVELMTFVLDPSPDGDLMLHIRWENTDVAIELKPAMTLAP